MQWKYMSAIGAYDGPFFKFESVVNEPSWQRPIEGPFGPEKALAYFCSQPFFAGL